MKGPFRFETRKRIWLVGFGRWRITPEVSCSCDVWRDSDWWMFWWLNLQVDSISKEWLRFCDEHGGGCL